MKTRLLIPCFCILLLSACSGDTDTPEGVVETYLKASMEQDVDTMREMLVKEEADMLQPLPDDWDARGPKEKISFDVGDATISGDTATVRVQHTVGDSDPISTDYTCIRQDGQWKLTLRGSRQTVESEPAR